MPTTTFDVVHALRTPASVPADLAASAQLLFIIGGRDAVEVAAQVTEVARRFPQARIVVIGDRHEKRGAMAAVRAGAHGYLGDSMNSAALVKSLELVMLDEMVLPGEFMKSLSDDLSAIGETTEATELVEAEKEGHAPMLSSRELSILKKLAAGSSNKVIAYDLAITEATVKVHVKSILRKIHARNRTQAAIWAVRNWSDLARQQTEPATIPG